MGWTDRHEYVLFHCRRWQIVKNDGTWHVRHKFVRETDLGPRGRWAAIVEYTPRNVLAKSLYDSSEPMINPSGTNTES